MPSAANAVAMAQPDARRRAGDDRDLARKLFHDHSPVARRRGVGRRVAGRPYRTLTRGSGGERGARGPAAWVPLEMRSGSAEASDRSVG